jgi:hypothetical protein
MNKSNGSLNDRHTVEYIVYGMESEVGADGMCWKQHGGEKLTYGTLCVTPQEGLSFVHIFYIHVTMHRNKYLCNKTN